METGALLLLILSVVANAPDPRSAAGAVCEAARVNTPGIALGITDHIWSISELIDAALKTVPQKPTPTASDRRRQFRVIQGGKKET